MPSPETWWGGVNHNNHTTHYNTYSYPVQQNEVAPTVAPLFRPILDVGNNVWSWFLSLLAQEFRSNPIVRAGSVYRLFATSR